MRSQTVRPWRTQPGRDEDSRDTNTHVCLCCPEDWEEYHCVFYCSLITAAFKPKPPAHTNTQFFLAFTGCVFFSSVWTLIKGESPDQVTSRSQGSSSRLGASWLRKWNTLRVWGLKPEMRVQREKNTEKKSHQSIRALSRCGLENRRWFTRGHGRKECASVIARETHTHTCGVNNEAVPDSAAFTGHSVPQCGLIISQMKHHNIYNIILISWKHRSLKNTNKH